MRGNEGFPKKQCQIQKSMAFEILEDKPNSGLFSYNLHDLEQPFCIYNLGIEIPVLKKLN